MAERHPGPDHPIAIEPTVGRVVVSVAGEIVAESRRALTLREASYPPVYYIPRADVAPSALRRTPRSTHCPYKGHASYFDLLPAGDRGANAVWSYESPYAAVVAIKDHLAFYADRVEIAVETP